MGVEDHGLSGCICLWLSGSSGMVGASRENMKTGDNEPGGGLFSSTGIAAGMFGEHSHRRPKWNAWGGLLSGKREAARVRAAAPLTLLKVWPQQFNVIFPGRLTECHERGDPRTLHRALRKTTGRARGRRRVHQDTGCTTHNGTLHTRHRLHRRSSRRRKAQSGKAPVGSDCDSAGGDGGPVFVEVVLMPPFALAALLLLEMLHIVQPPAAIPLRRCD